MFNKNFILFWIISAIFLLTIGYVTFVYSNWNDELPLDGAEVDISLPVINWDEYLQLSKSLK